MSHTGPKTLRAKYVPPGIDRAKLEEAIPRHVRNGLGLKGCVIVEWDRTMKLHIRQLSCKRNEK